MKVGVIFSAFQAEVYLPRSLKPWIEARRQRLDGHEFVICAVSVPFVGFAHTEEPDRTRAILGMHAQAGEIDHAIVRDKPMPETEARGAALQWLVAQGATDIIQADSDEFPTVAQLSRIFAFWAARPHVCWARLSYKNRVFTPDQYLVEPFTPPRIHRVHAPGSPYRIHSFHQDNNVTYGGTITRDLIPDDRFPSVTVPKGVAWIDHEAWLTNERSRRKCEYQLQRWGACSYRWDYSNRTLHFSEEFYAARGMQPPETAFD